MRDRLAVQSVLLGVVVASLLGAGHAATFGANPPGDDRWGTHQGITVRADDRWGTGRADLGRADDGRTDVTTDDRWGVERPDGRQGAGGTRDF
ncbi:hypothetical protein ABZW03_20270 [Kitasatospora sp. NPDC004799]|uniref:hypothetical protein n=1 Tax=Kitasatospora sp. NPDC004799 TaxID=3154460 RepID=UPI0033B903F4